MKKECTKCGISKSFSEFAKREISKDGLSYWCKQCVNEYNKRYRRRNKSYEAERKHLWYIKNKKRLMIKHAEYREAHRAEIKETAARLKKRKRDEKYLYFGRKVGKNE